ncbi:MAG TPA: hypothetical protein VFM88_20800 [Vicinamibacteria bacterium]|nr:hypothetical protein [Vicinamibacteria bacterium]
MTSTIDVKSLLDPDEILRAEFAYARDTALQANADRTQVVNLYLILVGGLGSVLLGIPALARGEGIALPRAAFGFILLMIGVLGLFSVLKLIRLRQAWRDSVLCMNHIKDFYLSYYPEMAPAFRWRTETIPLAGDVGTISFDLSVLVALIDSLAVGAGVLFFGAALPLAVVAGAGFMAAQAWLYFRLLAAS